MKDSLEDLIGRQLGPYQLVAPLGKGGMGVVYKAYDVQLARYVAVKVLPSRFALEPIFVSRFWQEAKAAANLEHPHILPVYAYGEHEGYHYIAMQLVREGSLAGLMHGQPLALGQIREIITQVGSALGYAHSREVIHRDVKPDNILISRRSGCLLTDFGIAKLLESTAHLTQTGTSLGTPTYMSPEQIQGAEDVDGRSDIYSLGVVLYQMATGRPPFQGETAQVVQLKHLYEPPPPPRDLNPELPEALVEVILKALAKSREARHATAYELARAVQVALPGSWVAGEEAGVAILGPAPAVAGVAAEEPESASPITAEELGAILDATSRPPSAEVRRHAVTEPVPRIRPVGPPRPPGPTEATTARPQPWPSRLRHIPVWVWALLLAALLLVVVGSIVLERRQRLLAEGAASPTLSAGAGAATPTAGIAALPSATPGMPPTAVPALTSSPRREGSAAPPPSATPLPSPSATPLLAVGETPSLTPAPSPTLEPSPSATPTPTRATAADLRGRLAIPLVAGYEPKVYIVSTRGELLGILGAARQPDYSPDGTRLVVNGEGGEWDKLRLSDASGGAPFEVGDPALAGHSYPSWSPDGTRLIYEDGTVDPVGWRIFIRDLNSNGPGSGAGSMLRPGVGQAELVGRHPLWTSDDRFVFGACDTWQPGQESECGLWVMQGNGGAPQRLTTNPNHIPTDVRRDTLVYASAERGDWSVYVLDLASGAVRQLTEDGADEGLATISPDGRSVAYLSNREGRLAVWVVGIRGGTARKLFDLPAEWGSLRPDGWSEEKLSWGAP